MANSARAQQIETLKVELNASSERAKALFRGHSNEQLLRRPASGGWSAAECIEHLALVTHLFLPDLEGARQKGARESFLSNAPFKLDLIGGLLLKMVGPSGRFKVKAAAGIPATLSTADVALQEYLASQQALFEHMEGFAAISLDNIKVASPFNAIIKYNIYSLLRIIEAHQRRHLLQAEKALGVNAPQAPNYAFQD